MMEISLEKRILCYSEYPNLLYAATSPIESFNVVIIYVRKKPLIGILIGIRSICSTAIPTQKKEILASNDIVSNSMMFNYDLSESIIESLKSVYTPYFTSVNDKQKG